MSGVTPNADAQRRSLLDPFQARVGILDDAAGCGGAGRRPGMRRVLPKVILKTEAGGDWMWRRWTPTWNVQGFTQSCFEERSKLWIFEESEQNLNS